MKPTRLSDVCAALRALDVHPSKRLGQNFLIDANILDIILATAELRAEDAVLEIGAGLGVLTAPLAAATRRVVAVEKDRRLHAYLQDHLLPQAHNVELIGADMLALDHEALLAGGINKVVANLPYATGGAILVNLLQARTPPQWMVLTLQLEVARRLVAAPSGSDYSLLSLWSQRRYDVAIRKIVSPTCFYPAPGVQSAVVRFALRPADAAWTAADTYFFKLTKFAFGHRRKQLQTVLRAPPPHWHLSSAQTAAAFAALALDPRLRPEALSVEQWRRLAERLAEGTGSCMPSTLQ